MTRRRLLVMALFCALAVPGAAERLKKVPIQPYVPGELVVRFRDKAVAGLPSGQPKARLASLGVAAAGLQRLHAQSGLRELEAVWPSFSAQASAASARRTMSLNRRGQDESRAERARGRLERSFILRFDRESDVQALLRSYQQDPNVEAVSPHYQGRVLKVPNDPYFASSGSWGQTYRDLWGLLKIDAPGAWDLSTGTGVVVAVIDTGVDYNHPDIQQNMWKNPVDGRHGFDTVSGDADPMDDNGHGTHVAGTIAATGDNAEGIIGVAYGARIMAIKSLTSYGGATETMLAQGVLYAADHGADVINCSWGIPSYWFLVQDAIDYASAGGAVIVAAAGNDNQDVGLWPEYPAASERVITVGASNVADARASFSNFGYKIDVLAPGGDDPSGGFFDYAYANILSLSASSGRARFDYPELLVGTRYFREAGTSMAAPHVAGLAALILSQRPGLTAEEVRQVIRFSADDVEAPGWDSESGYGRINALRALQTNTTVVAKILHPRVGAYVSDRLEVQGSAQGSDFDHYVLDYGEGRSPDSWSVLADSATPVDTELLGYFDGSALDQGDYTIRLRVFSRGGQVAMDQVNVYRDADWLEDRTLRLHEPTNGRRYRKGAAITMAASAHELDGGPGFIDDVIFYADKKRLATVTFPLGGTTFYYTWQNPPVGKHELRAEGLNLYKSTWSNTVTVYVDPVIVLESPAPGAAYLAGEAIPVAVDIQTPSPLDFISGARVEADGVVIHRASTTAYGAKALRFDWTDVAPGTYTLRAFASVDGELLQSDAVSIRVLFNAGLLPEVLGLSGAGERIPVNGLISVQARNAHRIEWSFAPVDAATIDPGQGGGEALNPVARASTNAPQLSLQGLNLAPGRYRIEITAYNRFGDRSAPFTATLELAPASLSEMRVYPSPWRSDRHAGEPMRFDSLPAGSEVKIYTLSGRWVQTLSAPNGSAVWHLRNGDGVDAATGVYFYVVTDDEGRQTRGKFAIIR